MESKLPELNMVMHDINMYCVENAIPNSELKPVWWENEITKLDTAIDLTILFRALPNAITKLFNGGDGHRLDAEVQTKIIDLAIILNDLLAEVHKREIEISRLLTKTGVILK